MVYSRRPEGRQTNISISGAIDTIIHALFAGSRRGAQALLGPLFTGQGTGTYDVTDGSMLVIQMYVPYGPNNHFVS